MDAFTIDSLALQALSMAAAKASRVESMELREELSERLLDDAALYVSQARRLQDSLGFVETQRLFADVRMNLLKRGAACGLV